MAKPSKKLLTYISGAVLIAVAVVFGAIISKPAETAVETVKVTVTGEVKFPGKYVLPAGSVVKDAIEAAGGFGEYADTAEIHPDTRLSDKQEIFVPIDVSKIP